MNIIVMSASKSTENEIRLVTELFEHGLEIFHLRKPNISTREMMAYLDAVPNHFHNRIVIHSHHSLAKKYNLRGIHITKQHLKKKYLTAFRIRLLKIKKPALTVSTSYHKISGVYENNVKYDYILLGTIFDQVSEKFNAGFSAHSLKEALGKSCTNVVARGGTQISNMQLCSDLGFSGMIFYSGIWKKENPVEEFCQIMDTLKKSNLIHA